MTIIDLPSPNHSPRPAGASPRFVVMHATAGPLQSSLDWLRSRASGVSCHYVVSKSGAVYRLVPEDRVAWHAGLAYWSGTNQVNAYSIGVELENANDGRDPYPYVQQQAARELVRGIMKRYSIRDENVVSHAQVAMPPGRKNDPLGFDMDVFRRSLTVRRFRVRGAAAYEDRSTTARVALGNGAVYGEGVVLEIDDVRDGWAHIVSGVGFVPLGCLEEI